MPVQFKDARFANFNPPVTIEDAFKFYGSFSGIHTFDFDSAFLHAGAAGWSSSSATANYTSTDVSLNAGILSAGWYYAVQSADLPASFKATYHKEQYRQGLYIELPDGDKFIAGTDSSGNPLIVKYSSGSWGTVQSVPSGSPTIGDMVVAFRQVQFDDTNSSFWRCISIYSNDALLTTYEEFSDEPIDGYIHVGFAVYGGDSLTYSNLRIAELTRFAEYGTIDAGSAPMDGLQLTTEGLNIRYHVRWDGSLRAHLVKAIDSELTVPGEDVDRVVPNADFRAIKSHIRMVGAYTWAEMKDDDLIETVGHRFVQTDNPMLMSEQECYDEGLRVLKRIAESAYTCDADLAAKLTMEIEDRIILDYDAPDFDPDNDWLVNGISINISGSDMTCSASLRKYVWGD